MGFFSSLIKNIAQDVVRDEASRVVRNETSKVVRNTIGEEIKGNVNVVNNREKIPANYSHFPIFEGTLTDVSTKKTSNYERCTMDYYPVSEDLVNSYRDKIISEGYQKMTNVRYEKNNEYIIVDFNGDELNLVYHIKF